MDEEIKQLYKDNINLLDESGRIHREVSLAHERVRERALTHTYQLITVIGIVAGFGFTAIGSIKCLILFVVGELSLLAGMGVGMWFAKAGFIDEIKYYSECGEKINEVREDRMKIKFDGSISLKEIRIKMEEAKNKELSVFKNETKNASYKWLSMVFYLFIFGGVILLISLAI